MTSTEISWHVELAVKPGQLENFRTLTSEMVETTRSEPGVLIYERFLAPDQTTVHIYERYKDSAAAVTHLRDFEQMYGARFIQLVERRHFTVFGTPSDELRAIFDRIGVTYAGLLDGFSQMAGS